MTYDMVENNPYNTILSFNYEHLPPFSQIIKAATRLQLVVSRVGRIPGSHTVLESFRWTDPKGRPVSPPPEGSGGAAGEDDGRGRSGTRMLQGSDERKVVMSIERLNTID